MLNSYRSNSGIEADSGPTEAQAQPFKIGRKLRGKLFVEAIR